MEIKLIATDLDGTLLKNDKTIDPETRECLIKFQENGGILVLISGRRINEIWDYINSLKMLNFKSGYIVSCDGQYIWDISLDKTVKSEFLCLQDITYLLGKVKANNYNVSFYDENNDFLLLNNKFFFRTLLQYSYHKIVKRNSRIKLVTHSRATQLCKICNIEKVSLKKRNSKGQTTLYYLNLSNELHDYNVVFLEGRKIEISQKNVNKREALKQIMQWNHLLNEDVLVFGDEGNDIHMLSYFKNSYAMGNANEYVKQVAKFVTDTNENQGVLKVLKYYKCNLEYMYQTKQM